MIRTTSFVARLTGITSLFFSVPLAVAFAAAPDTAGVDTLGTFLLTIIYFIDRYVVPFIFALAFLIFLWGIYSTFIAGAANEEKRQEGQKILIYGMVGFFIMISLWGLVNLLVGTFGLHRSTRPDYPVFGPPTSGTKTTNPFNDTKDTGGSGGSDTGYKCPPGTEVVPNAEEYGCVAKQQPIDNGSCQSDADCLPKETCAPISGTNACIPK